jgi:hypothetical protein
MQLDHERRITADCATWLRCAVAGPIVRANWFAFSPFRR